MITILTEVSKGVAVLPRRDVFFPPSLLTEKIHGVQTCFIETPENMDMEEHGDFASLSTINFLCDTLPEVPVVSPLTPCVIL